MEQITITIYRPMFESQKNSPVNIYLLKANNGNTRKRCEICSKITIKTPEQCH